MHCVLAPSWRRSSSPRRIRPITPRVVAGLHYSLLLLLLLLLLSRKICWGSVSFRAKEFILALLKVDPDNRLTAEQALRHPWLAEAGGGTDDDEHDLALSLVRM